MVVRKSYAGIDLHSLNELAYLTFEDAGPIPTRVASVRALVKRGRAIELCGRRECQGWTRSSKTIFTSDPTTGRPILVYRVFLTDAHIPIRLVYVLAGQLAGEDHVREPIRLDEKNLAIYREVRSAIIAARNHAARADVSRRKMLMDRAGFEARRQYAKMKKIDPTVLDEIIRLGEIADGTAARKALVNSPAKQAARDRNNAMLQVVDQQIALGVNQALIQAAKGRQGRLTDISLTTRRPSLDFPRRPSFSGAAWDTRWTKRAFSSTAPASSPCVTGTNRNRPGDNGVM